MRKTEVKRGKPLQESRRKAVQESLPIRIVSAFIDKAKQYTKIDELISEVLRLFIERIEVGERTEKWSRTAMQEISIYYRDIGLLDNVIELQTDESTQQKPSEVA